MTTLKRKPARNHDDILEEIAAALDIPESTLEEAVDRYNSIGAWLDRKESSLSKCRPAISPQGSFLLGTVIRPLSDAEEYDVDLVCILKASKKDFTQKSLKDAVGHEIKLYARARNMAKRPKEGRRCWTLHYADDAQFHIDVLPALPDANSYKSMLLERGHADLAREDTISGQAIAITDRTLPQYALLSEDWPQSNPMGYAAWFRNRMRAQLFERKTAFAERQRITASVDDIPDYKVKTPLQRAIQLLKRHRDNMFAHDGKHKPISIIITTLSAQSYNEEPSISSALQSILRGMDQHIKNRGGEAWIANPVNPEENFADKWAEEPTKRENFHNWLEQARHDFALYLRGSPYNVIPDDLKRTLGNDLVERSVTPVLEATAETPGAPAIIKPSSNADEERRRAEAAIREVERTGPQSRPWADKR